MDIQVAENLALDLMRQHLLIGTGWRFQWDHAKMRFGICYGGRKIIGLSRPLVAVNDESQVRDTILHEIAHALVGIAHKHDFVWQMKARELGARPEACYAATNVVQVECDYKATCADCGKVINRPRRPNAGLLLSATHTPCKREPNKGTIYWTHKGQPIGFARPILPMAAAAIQAPRIQETLTQSDISAMWERLNKLEGKL
jgi:predicted SprT family Zn-dependent metalloprotease